jgi:ATP-dependent Clp protease adaptor protein ClpS
MKKIPKSDNDASIKEKTILKPQKPGKYAVVILNDDYTPMEFVVWILQKIFFKTRDESARIMLEAHTTGKAICGIFTLDVARTKMMLVKDTAEEHSHPLNCVLEKLEE